MVIVMNFFAEWLEFFNVKISSQEIFNIFKVSLFIILVTVVSYLIIQYLFTKLFIKLTKKTKTKWEDIS